MIVKEVVPAVAKVVVVAVVAQDVLVVAPVAVKAVVPVVAVVVVAQVVVVVAQEDVKVPQNVKPVLHLVRRIAPLWLLIIVVHVVRIVIRFALIIVNQPALIVQLGHAAMRVVLELA